MDLAKISNNIVRLFLMHHYSEVLQTMIPKEVAGVVGVSSLPPRALCDLIDSDYTEVLGYLNRELVRSAKVGDLLLCINNVEVPDLLTVGKIYRLARTVGESDIVDAVAVAELDEPEDTLGQWFTITRFCLLPPAEGL